MRRRRTILIVCALAAFGCTKPPEAVFVDLDAIFRRESAQLPVAPMVGEVASTIILPRVAILPPLRSVTIQDLAADQIGEAQRLIAEDRQRAVATLTRRLGDARRKEIEVQRIAAEQALENRVAGFWSGVYDQLYGVFQKYATQRGPQELRLEVLKARKPELFPSRAAFSAMVMKPTFAEQNEAEIREKIVKIAGLDAQYEVDATRILNSAQSSLRQERTAIKKKYDDLTRVALQDAAREAAKSIGRTGTPSGLNLGQNRSVTVAPVGGRSLGIPGSASTIDDFAGLKLVALTDQEERRRSLESQLEIWLKTSGYKRTLTRRTGNDRTEDFDSWRKKHRLGP